MSIQDTFHIIQDDLNGLQVKARLMSKGADRHILDQVMPKYEDAVHSIIYPVIVP